MTVLILAAERDPTADRMVQELGRRSADLMRIDTAWFPANVHLDARFTSGRWSGTLCAHGRSVELQELRAVWYRSPSAFTFSPELSPVERQWASNEAKMGIGGVLSSLPLRWVNHPARHADAAAKPVQLAVAARCGLTVPDTLVTNLPDAVRDFATDRATVTKALGAPAIVEAGRRATAFTYRLCPSDMADLRGVEVTTHQFQRWVEKAHEVRAIVIGDQVFAAGIHAGSEETRLDWRNNYSELAYSRPTVPDYVHAALVAYLKEFRCEYGAFDLIVRPDGGWVFLECNPGGQYGFIEDATGYPITPTIAELLSEGPR